MAILGELTVEIGGDTSGLKKAETEVKKSSNRMEQSFSRLGSAIAAAISVETARQVALIADRMTRLEGTVRRLTKSTGDFEKVWSKLIDVSNENGAAIQDTTALFQRFQMTMDNIVDSNDDVLSFVDTLQKIGRLGGSSAEEMSNALTQLSQGFAGGIIRAEEFNSVSEQMPFLLKIAADNIEGLNGDIGALRKAMLDGQLTADTFYKAIKRGSEGINDEFEDLPDTIDLASQKFNNNLSVAISKLDKQIGASENIASFISSMATLIEYLSSSGLERGGLAKTTEEIGNEIVATDARIKSLKLTIEELESAVSGDSVSDKLVRFFEGDDLQASLAENRRKLEEEEKLYADLYGRLESTMAGELPSNKGTTGITEPTTPKATLGATTSDDKVLKNEKEAAQTLLDDIYLASLNQKDRLLALEQEQLEQLMDNYEKGYITFEEHQAAMVQTGKDFAEQRAEIEKKNVNEISMAYQQLGNTIGNELGNALAQTQSWSDAMRSIIGNLASQLITAGITSAFGGSVGGGNLFSGLFTGGGNAMGGGTSGMLAHPINERGVPEVYEQNGQQYLLPTGGPGRVEPLQKSSGGSPNVSIVSMGEPQQVSAVSMNDGEIRVMIDNAINQYDKALNAQLSTGKGRTAKSLQAGFQVKRNLGIK